MLLNTLQCAGQSPRVKKDAASDVSSVEIEKPCMNYLEKKCMYLRSSHCTPEKIPDGLDGINQADPSVFVLPLLSLPLSFCI